MCSGTQAHDLRMDIALVLVKCLLCYFLQCLNAFFQYHIEPVVLCRCGGWHQHGPYSCPWTCGLRGAPHYQVGLTGRRPHGCGLLRAGQHEVPSREHPCRTATSRPQNHQLETFSKSIHRQIPYNSLSFPSNLLKTTSLPLQEVCLE